MMSIDYFRAINLCELKIIYRQIKMVFHYVDAINKDSIHVKTIFNNYNLILDIPQIKLNSYLRNQIYLDFLLDNEIAI